MVKNIMQTLALFKGGEAHDTRQVGPGLRSFQAFEEPTRDPDVWPAPPPRDNVWSSGSSGSNAGSSVVKPVRGPRKDTRTERGTGQPGAGGGRASKQGNGPKRSTAGPKASSKTNKSESESKRRPRGGASSNEPKKEEKNNDKVKIKPLVTFNAKFGVRWHFFRSKEIKRLQMCKSMYKLVFILANLQSRPC